MDRNIQEFISKNSRPCFELATESDIDHIKSEASSTNTVAVVGVFKTKDSPEVTVFEKAVLELDFVRCAAVFGVPALASKVSISSTDKG